VLGLTTGRGGIVIFFLEHLRFETGQQGPGFGAGVKCHALAADPAIPVALELSRKPATGLQAVHDFCPDPGKGLRGTERQGET